jgi:hypothetical protein
LSTASRRGGPLVSEPLVSAPIRFAIVTQYLSPYFSSAHIRPNPPQSMTIL